VRWASLQLTANSFQHAVEIAEHVVISEPDDSIAGAVEFGLASIVGVRLLGLPQLLQGAPNPLLRVGGIPP
jgi:hypothetical protein